MHWRHAGARTNRVLVVVKKVEEDVDGGAVRAEHRGQERGIGRVTVERNERASPSVETIYARFC